ncbi:MAG: DUF1298 domain-containing protein, partial [Acidobacteria bacterium]|nr:DUF1298 domain-containing protein [Acidobacteriota bacterium]
GATVNDVVLAVCAGGFRRLLLRENELPGKPLVAMTPISVRSQDARGTMGNQVSAMLVSLATDEADPLKRLDAIRTGARDSKMYHHAMGARTIMDLTDAIPFSLTGRAARLYSELQLSRFHAPAFNAVLTNVPGPQTPLYMAGARLLTNVGAGPIFDAIGLFMPITSYAGTLSIGITSCREMLPDVPAFCADLTASLEELEQALGLLRLVKTRTRKAVPRRKRA